MDMRIPREQFESGKYKYRIDDRVKTGGYYILRMDSGYPIPFGVILNSLTYEKLKKSMPLEVFTDEEWLEGRKKQTKPQSFVTPIYQPHMPMLTEESRKSALIEFYKMFGNEETV